MSSIKTSKKRVRSVDEPKSPIPVKKQKLEENKSSESPKKSSSYPNRLRDFIKNKKSRKLLKKRNIKYLFPIQAQTYFSVLEGRDMFARDRTGSGKTLSYALPLTERLRDRGVFSELKKNQLPLVLIVLPTRELAIQVTNEITLLKHSPNEFRLVNVYGGTEIRPQIMDLKQGAEIVVGTPGRILDLIERNCLNFKDIQTLVLDEADQMLDLGFKDAVEKIFETMKLHNPTNKPQYMLFSATIPHWVMDIAKKHVSSDRLFIDLVKNTEIKTAKTVEHFALNLPYHMRTEIIGDIILCYGGHHCRTIIFTETKQEANDIMLKAKIKQECQLLHGDIPQKQREINYQGFREGKFKCLIATNIAARGLDIPEIDLIVQLDPPKDVDTYIHRAGRTARAGRKGACITFYTKKQVFLIERIEKKANITFKRVGIPQPTDILKASVKNIIHSLTNVSTDMLGLFQTDANELIKTLGAEEAVARSLAYLSGYTDKFKQRSLLCGFEGWVTYVIRSKIEFRTMGFIWSFLKSNLEPSVCEKIKGMRSFKDRKGAVFDILEEDQDKLEEMSKTHTNNNFEIEIAETLPELMDEAPTFSTNSNAPNNNFGNRNSNGYGNRDNSRNRGGGGNSGFKGRKELEIFIGGLPFNVREQEITDFFTKNGVKFSNVNLLYGDEERQNFKGIAFAVCIDEIALEKALKLAGSNLMGRAIRINKSSEKPNGR